MPSQESNRNASVLVDTTPVVVAEGLAPPDNFRRVITIINTSTGGQVITIQIGDEAVAGSGIVLNAGGYYNESQDAGFTPSNARFTAVSDLAGGLLAVQERVVRTW